MAQKNYRIIARKTIYCYIDVVASSKEEAGAKGWATKPDEFMPLPDPQNEFKVIDAVLKDRSEPVDDLRYLTKQ